VTTVPPPASTTAGRRVRGRVGVGRVSRQLGGVVTAVVLWELISVSGLVTRQALASVPDTFRALFQHAGSLAPAAGSTLEAWAVGLAIAVVSGVGLGTMVGRSRVAEASTEVLVRMMRPLPSLALIPIAILVAGLGLKMTAGLVAFTSFWPVFINTRYGVHQVDNVFIDTGRTLELSRFGLLSRVIIPAAAPLIASGVQVAISLALVVTVSVELVGGTGGIGSFVLQAQQANAVPTMYAGILVGGLVGWGLNVGFRGLCARLLPWADRAEVRS
jgi:ABC-type nitrate/sulfonate/bicarbonate transport system permease component